jgi:hypothetical protein
VDGSTRPAPCSAPACPGRRRRGGAPDRPLVVSAELDGQPQLYRDNGTLFAAVQPGEAPTYPG